MPILPFLSSQLKLGCARAVRRGLRFAQAQDMEAKKGQFAHLGKGGCIAPTTQIMRPEGMWVGANVFMGDDCYVYADGGLMIEDNTHISRRVTIYTSDHDWRRGDYLPYGPNRVKRSVSIGKNVWIGMNVCILPGVSIGDGAIIGMGAVVAKSVPPLTIVGQPEYRVLGTRHQGPYLAMEEDGRYGGRSGYPI